VDYGGHAWEHEIEAFPFLCRNASDRPLFRTPNGRPEMELEVCEHRLLHHALRNLTCGGHPHSFCPSMATTSTRMA